MIILLILFIIISGISKAIGDICSESSFYKSKLVTIFKLNSKYWQKSESSVNKWKNFDKSKGEAFFGSSTVFVFLTDGWHLMDIIKILSYIFIGLLSKTILIATLSLVVSLILFELIYSYLKN